MRFFLIASAIALLASHALRSEDKPIDVPIGNPRYRLVGKLHEPLGTVVTIQGLIVDGPGKGYEEGPIIRVHRVNGRATQEQIRMKARVGWTEFGASLPKLEAGLTLELKGYETGEFVGIPNAALRGLQNIPQTSDYYFSHTFVFHQAKRIDPFAWVPADFVDREALIEGRAVSQDKRAFIAGGDWRLLVDANAPWPAGFEDKTVEGFGTIRSTADATTYRLEKGNTRLVKLQDQVGRQVALRGSAWHSGKDWWLNYRGTRLYVEGLSELPGWKPQEMYGRPVLITGVLEEAMLPNLDQNGIRIEPEQKKQFIVRKPSWKPIDALLAPERVER